MLYYNWPIAVIHFFKTQVHSSLGLGGKHPFSGQSHLKCEVTYQLKHITLCHATKTVYTNNYGNSMLKSAKVAV